MVNEMKRVTVSCFRVEVPALCWDPAQGHQTWKPAGQQQLSAEGEPPTRLCAV